MKRFAVILAALLLAGCATQVSPTLPVETTAETTTAETTTETTTTTTTTVTETTTVAPTPAPQRSVTTGLIVPDGTKYLPAACTLSNVDGARPQWNIKEADIIYEFLMEGRQFTRFLGIFNDTLPEEVGPVRSCRWPFLDIITMWQAPFAFCGGSSVEPVIVDDRIGSVPLSIYADNLYGRFDKYFTRRSDRNAPHNLVVNLSMLANDAPEWDYPTDLMTFDESYQPGGSGVSRVQAWFDKKYQEASFAYDAADHLWVREAVNGEVRCDADSTPIAVTNLVFLMMEYKTISPNAHLGITSTGTGTCYVYMDGKQVAGTWSRETLDDPIVLKDMSGAVLPLHPGKTWFAIVDADAPVITEP